MTVAHFESDIQSLDTADEYKFSDSPLPRKITRRQNCPYCGSVIRLWADEGSRSFWATFVRHHIKCAENNGFREWLAEQQAGI
jgi:hypothetical protein